MKLYNLLEDTLKKEPNYVTDSGELKKWVVLNKAKQYDKDVLKLLLSEDELKEQFFIAFEDTLVFNLNKFSHFLEQKNYLIDSFTKYKNKIGLAVEGKHLKEQNEVSLVWPYKDCILEGGQNREEDRKNEIFFNETLAQDEITQLLDPKVLTNAKRYDKDGSKPLEKFNRDKKGTITDNLIIKGNNLLALHSIKQEFSGKVKLIYIDPPFNTGNDGFRYNDSFNHASWLTFMKNRLVTAKDLLTSNGSIFVQCDNNEFSYLSILLDEVFGRANFVNVISVKSSTPSGVKTSHANKKILKSQDFIFVYKKSEFLIKPQFTKKDKWDTHYMFYVRNNKLIKLVDVLKEENLLNEKQNLKHFDVNDKKHKAFYIANGDNIVRKSTHENKAIKSACNNEYKDKIYNSNNNLYLNNDMLQPISKSFQTVLDGQNLTEDISNLLCDFWSDIDFQNTQNQGGVSFPAGKKPEQLLYRIIDMVTEPNDIVLDFHLGSGTTAAVAHKMKRQYIGIEQMDYIQNISTKRLTNVINGENGGISTALSWNGGGEFLYFELKKYNQSFVEKIEEAKDTKSLLNIWEKMKEKSFLNYNINIKAQDGNIEEFKSLELTQQKELLVEILDKNQMYVNLSSMDDSDFEVTDEEKKITKAFYNLNKM